MYIPHPLVLISKTQICVKTTQSCVHCSNTRICVLSQHKCFQNVGQKFIARIYYKNLSPGFSACIFYEYLLREFITWTYCTILFPDINTRQQAYQMRKFITQANCSGLQQSLIYEGEQICWYMFNTALHNAAFKLNCITQHYIQDKLHCAALHSR